MLCDVIDTLIKLINHGCTIDVEVKSQPEPNAANDRESDSSDAANDRESDSSDAANDRESDSSNTENEKDSKVSIIITLQIKGDQRHMHRKRTLCQNIL